MGPRWRGKKGDRIPVISSLLRDQLYAVMEHKPMAIICISMVSNQGGQSKRPGVIQVALPPHVNVRDGELRVPLCLCSLNLWIQRCLALHW